MDVRLSVDSAVGISTSGSRKLLLPAKKQFQRTTCFHSSPPEPKSECNRSLSDLSELPLGGFSYVHHAQAGGFPNSSPHFKLSASAAGHGFI